jgi:uncharacterized C2H2 Zn-finger protein
MADIRPLVISSEIPFITCGRCKFIVLVNEVFTYLHKQHKYKPKKARSIEAKARQVVGVMQNQDELHIWQPPPATSNAIPELGQPATDGLSCDECQYIIRDVKTMQKHFHSHGWVNPEKKGGNAMGRSKQAREVPWRANVRCQRLGRSRYSNRWIEVEKG